jgi:hypothetical protein
MGIRLFISHSERDRDIVLPLKDWLESGLGLQSEEVRCTSATNIDAGGFAVETLRKDIESAKAVVGLITSNSLPSHWVSLEMGAAWLQERLIPIRGPGLAMKDVPLPLSQFTMVDYCNKEAMRELLDNLSKRIGASVLPGTDDEFDRMAQSASDQLASEMVSWFSLPPVLSAYMLDNNRHISALRSLCATLRLNPEDLLACVTPKGMLIREPNHLPERARDLWNISKSAVNFMLSREKRHFADYLNIPSGILNEQLITDMKKALDSRWNHVSRVRNWFGDAKNWISENPLGVQKEDGHSAHH